MQQGLPPSPDPPQLDDRIVESLRRLRKAIAKGDRLEKKFTARRVELKLEPFQYTAEGIQSLRLSLNLSQPVFAELIGVSVNTVQKWEQARTPAPKWARRMFDLLRHDPAAFFGAVDTDEVRDDTVCA